ncbi:hypothetical protein [Streptomyces sp. NPDC048659]|uniref:hypothetical protein n=1 Tax=Streptomyces sp. NPDC048659 TaxID=3155489 RepID=UPI00341E2EF6
MDPIGYRFGTEARRGGMDVTISLTAAEAAQVGDDAGILADWFHSALWALAILRAGHVPANPDHPHPDARKDRTAGPGDWYTVVNDLDYRLLPRLEGIRDAAIRAHAAAGGSVGDMALAMDVSRSTAQYRRDAVRQADPSVWEQWATRTREPRPRCVACGHPARSTDALVVTDGGFQVHRSHTEDTTSGFHGATIVHDLGAEAGQD